MNAERAAVAELQADHRALSRELASSKAIELEKRRLLVNSADEIEKMRMKHGRETMELELEVQKCARKIRELTEELRLAKEDLDREREAGATLRSTVSHQSTAQITLNAQIDALQAEKTALQAQLDATTSRVSQQILDQEYTQRRIAELEAEAREAEMVRRKLHNMVLDLKGNIRVFCRDIMANITFPDKDHKEIRREIYNFSFDRVSSCASSCDFTAHTRPQVFEPKSTQGNVFEEISLLAQSCVDGYNVCIFAYGQTGSGKSFTMEGGTTEATMGMIPRAVNEVFRAVEALKSKGWEYNMEGQFLEIYNETINDLLGKGEFDKKKHEIKHEKTATSASTRVTDVNIMPLHTPREVTALLRLANSRRTVAATLMNERSSRSHSVFTLRIFGNNQYSGERCEGSLNLVDLAGSERLNSSGAAGHKERLKETQNINRSLSALGDVIAALGEKGEKHIPYRNSKLTYLLQNSLSGNSKTLMILNLSPLATHFSESLTSLRFATKVNNTTIGTAKKQVRGAS
ncbi:P-loop containing nucleoside triphosphate hydrolase protein [Melanogaster broomeanus]|nr:P-loop containing nucleoside triphosphate hydrolase protein [Melanogaster broomeanus]